MVGFKFAFLKNLWYNKVSKVKWRNIMVEIGIPVYNAVDTLPKTLDSLVSQTVNDFCVCLSIDGDFQN